METYESAGGSGLVAAMGVFFLFYIGFLILMVASLWKIFSKAGKPGWAAIVPIYNLIVWLEIVGKPVWWIVLLLLPIVNLIVLIILMHRMSVVFGQGVGTTLLLIFLPFIGFPMLAFGSAQYVGSPTLEARPA